jgi:hypothetical protein
VAFATKHRDSKFVIQFDKENARRSIEAIEKHYDN